MVAIVVESPNKLKLCSSEPTAPGTGELLVRIRRAGICGSDIHILEGSNPFARYPRIIGHEFAGVIEEIGPGVTGHAIGDQVVIDPVIACGKCYACQIGRHNVCAKLEVMGVHRDGGFQDYLVVPATNAIHIPPSLPIEIAALAEPFSIAANVLSRTGCREDDVVLIYGAGTVGLTVLQVAKLKGARCIIADLDTKRLERAIEFGADMTIHATPGAVRKAVALENDGLGPTLIIDGAGVPEILTEAASIISPAGRIGLLGFLAKPSKIFQKEVVSKEISIHGSRLSRGYLPQVISWLANGTLQPAGMITQTYPAREALAAFELIGRDPSVTIKIQLEF
jgi:L-gulonate 5-dehydrogenase